MTIKMKNIPAYGAIAAMVVVGATWVAFLRDAPAAMEHIPGHHDSLTVLFDERTEIIQHLENDEIAFAKLTTQVDYLVCLRIERSRELRGDPPLTDCDADLLNR